MRQIGSEVITIAAGQTKTLTRSAIDNATGNARATVAVITNHDLGDSDVGFRISESAPVEADYTYHPVLAGQSISVDGYDNLIAAQFILLGTTTAKLFVEYYV